MFARMVVLFYVHSICVGANNETSLACKVFRLCCDKKSEKCALNFKFYFLRTFTNFTFNDDDLMFGKPCEKMKLVEDLKWSFEVQSFDSLKLN